MNGIVIGRFMPPHHGHLFLVDFARNLVDTLHVLVCTLQHEPIPGELRYEWMRELCPDSRVVHITEEIPEAQRGMPGAAVIWADAVRRYVDGSVHRVFASEPYGWDLAAELDAEFVPVDPSRSNIPVSASAIREHPMREWRFIPPPVRPYYVKHVAVVAAPDVADTLGTELETVVVHDYGSFLGSFPLPRGHDAFRASLIDAGRASTVLALARHANRVLIHSVADPSAIERWDLVIETVEANESGTTALAAKVRTRFGIE